MKSFFKRIFQLISPIIILFIILEMLLRTIPNDYSFKRKYLDKNSNEIEVLFLGSSHSYYGINPKFIDKKSFNGSHISQSIDIDFEIIKKYSKDLKQLEFIVMPIGYSSFFSRTSAGIESWRIKNYNIYYNLYLSKNIKNYFELLSLSLEKNYSRILSYHIDNKTEITCSYLGYGYIQRDQQDLLLSGISAAKRHSINNKQYYHKNISIVNQIVDYAEKNGVIVIFYTSPAYYTYTANLNENQLISTTRTIDSISSESDHCYYFNLLTDNQFKAEDFRDADHLNDLGAEKLSKRINDKINELK